jgi:carbon-monoxide dehydrogenase medium subunit
MKPAAFLYQAPRSRAEALDAVAAHGDDGKVLAGGQSLVPAMNFRLARPAVLIDITRVPDLSTIARDGTSLRIGALSRHARFERPVTDGPLGALLPEVARHIAHTPIRARGTFGGSLAHADPASEWCALAVALNATIVAESKAGVRTIAARDFFQSIFTTALKPDELLTEIRLPWLSADWRCGFAEYSRRAGDFALAMAVVALRLEQGVIREASIALGGVGATPLPAVGAARLLLGATPSDALLAASGDAASREVDPQGDIHATPTYRRELVGAMTRRALRQALAA